MPRLLMAAVLLTLTLGAPRALEIALYGNPARISGASADSVLALLQGFGHTVSSFSGLSAAEFSAGLAGADLVFFPEMLNYGQLVGELQPGALLALSAFISGGGGLIAVGDYGHRLLNAVFCPACDFVTVYCLAGSGTLGPSLLDSLAAAGTSYAGAPPASACRRSRSPPSTITPFSPSAGPTPTRISMAPPRPWPRPSVRAASAC